MYNPRIDRIKRLQKKLERSAEKLKRNYRSSSDMLSDLSQFSKIEREIEIQQAYLQLENMENSNG